MRHDAVLLFAAVLHPALLGAGPVDVSITNPNRTGAPGSVAVFQGSITNHTGAVLRATDLFLNFSGFDPANVTFDQVLGLSDFSIPNGATSGIVDLFTLALAGTAAVPATYAAEVVVSTSLDTVTDAQTVSLKTSGASAGCFAPVTPANLLVGQKWAYELVNPAVPPSYDGARIGAVGTFTGFAGGRLDVMETRNSNGNVSRGANLTGQWTVNSDCTGTLRWSVGGQIFWLNFKTTSASTMEIFTDPGTVKEEALAGQARLSPPMACPAANTTNPLTLMAGMMYDYRLEGAGFVERGDFSPALSSAFAWSGNLTTNRNIYIPPNAMMPSVRMPGTGGRYLVYSDCSGGELLFNTNGYVRQLEFVFSKADFTELYIVEDGYGNPLVTGVATKR